MTAFAKENFTTGEYLMYNISGESKFIARFKRSGAPFTRSQFIRELVKNHTVESYLEAMEAGSAPLTILRDANPVWYHAVLNKFYDKCKG